MNDRPPRFHLALAVAGPRFDAAVRFYATLFGGEPSKLEPGYAKFEPAEPWVNFTLNATPTVTRGEIDHLGIQVWSGAALSAARTRLRAAGLELREEPGVECCYAGQDKFWVIDPEGREVEFFHVLRDLDHHGRLPLLAPGGSACCGGDGASGATKSADAASAECTEPRSRE